MSYVVITYKCHLLEGLDLLVQVSSALCQVTWWGGAGWVGWGGVKRVYFLDAVVHIHTASGRSHGKYLLVAHRNVSGQTVMVFTVFSRCSKEDGTYSRCTGSWR